MPITTRSSSAWTGTRPGARRAASASECASTSSVLRPLPVTNTRTCADSFGGTSSTTSRSWTRRCARCRPMPLQPSTGQTRSANLRPAASICAYPAVSVPYLPAASTLAWSSMTSIVAERLCGSIPIITPTGFLLGRSRRLPARRALLLRAGQTPFEPPPHGARREAGHERATPKTTASSRNVGASRQAPGPSLAGLDPAPKSLSSRDGDCLSSGLACTELHNRSEDTWWLRRPTLAPSRGRLRGRPGGWSGQIQA